MLDEIRHFFDYATWANSRALASVETVAAERPSALRPLGHLLAAERVWLLRLTGQDASHVELSPDFTLEECRALVEENRVAFEQFLGGLEQSALASAVVYRTTKGVEYHTPVREILTQLLMHGVHHRGQMASAVRAEGGTPASTDYITFVRETGGR